MKLNNIDFNKSIEILFESLKRGEKFAFSKYADGEYKILINEKITNCDNWTFDPEIHQTHQQELLDSFTYYEEGYYIGVSCPCCVPNQDVMWMRNNVGAPQTNITWANIFVNSNYKFFVDNFIPEFNNHDIILIANQESVLGYLPFEVEEFIPITNTAWFDNFDLVKSLPNKEYKDKLFLFCAGPLGNMLAAKMWGKNKSNTYLDIGSTLTPYLLGINNRGYLQGNNSINKKCVW